MNGYQFINDKNRILYFIHVITAIGAHNHVNVIIPLFRSQFKQKLIISEWPPKIYFLKAINLYSDIISVIVSWGKMMTFT